MPSSLQIFNISTSSVSLSVLYRGKSSRFRLPHRLCKERTSISSSDLRLGYFGGFQRSGSLRGICTTILGLLLGRRLIRLFKAETDNGVSRNPVSSARLTRRASCTLDPTPIQATRSTLVNPTWLGFTAAASLRHSGVKMEHYEFCTRPRYYLPSIPPTWTGIVDLDPTQSSYA